MDGSPVSATGLIAAMLDCCGGGAGRVTEGKIFNPIWTQPLLHPFPLSKKEIKIKGKK